MLHTRTGRLSSLLLLTAVALAGFFLDTSQPWIARAQDAEPSYEDELEKGKTLYRQRRYDDALKSFKRANEMRDKKSAECYGWMSETYLALEAYKNVVDSADKVIELAGGDKQLMLKAFNNKGIALQASAARKDQKKLQAAEAVFRGGLAFEGTLPVLHYNLGMVLMQLKRDDEGAASLKRYIELQPKGQFVDMARKLIENPRRARENYAPDFSFTSSQGEHIALDDLKGKVVVLDFWGTWCPPCVQSVPELRNLHKRYSKEPSFMLIGISSDGDENVWRDFTDRNKMIWPQYLDRDRRVQRAFGVRAFPTYVLIDHEGIVQFTSVGSSWQSSANLHDAIKKQVKLVAKATELQ